MVQSGRFSDRLLLKLKLSNLSEWSNARFAFENVNINFYSSRIAIAPLYSAFCVVSPVIRVCNYFWRKKVTRKIYTNNGHSLKLQILRQLSEVKLRLFGIRRSRCHFPSFLFSRPFSRSCFSRIGLVLSTFVVSFSSLRSFAKLAGWRATRRIGR